MAAVDDWSEIALHESALPMFVLYRHPTDHPDVFVMRLWRVLPGHTDPLPSEEFMVAKTADELIDNLPPGLFRIERDPNDESQIVASWV